jgi:hypothetical protein
LDNIRSQKEAPINKKTCTDAAEFPTSFVDHELGCGGVLTHARAGDVASVGESGMKDDELVDALVQPLDLDSIVLGDNFAGHLPFRRRLVVAHLALKDDLIFLLAGLALQLLSSTLE